MKKTILIASVLALFAVACSKAPSNPTSTKADTVVVDSLVYDSVVISHKSDTIIIDSTKVK